MTHRDYVPAQSTFSLFDLMPNTAINLGNGEIQTYHKLAAALPVSSI